MYPLEMLENSSEVLCQDVYKFLTGKRLETKCLLVKRHTENLQQHGDFSFPNLVNSWHGHVELPCKNPSHSLLECICTKAEDLVTTSKEWPLPIAKTKELKDRIHLYLDRTVAIKVGLNQGLRNNTMLLTKINEFVTSTVACDPLCEDTNDLTSLRLKCLTRCIENLHKTASKSNHKIFVTSKSSSKCPEDSILVHCGTVLNARSGVKETVISADEYIRIRQNEMLLVAQHKYGVRVSTDSKWKEFIAHLGESAVVFELLQTKPSSAVKINFECPSGSSKGATFILYNCARLETIIRTYNDKVDEGVYPPLPEFDDTDFSLLTQEDEWTQIFNFIMGLPSLLNNCLEVNDNCCHFRPHQLCTFLSSMVHGFSQYYRRVRILTEPRKHLLPEIFARMQMLIVLNETLKICLKILNIKSVSQM